MARKNYDYLDIRDEIEEKLSLLEDFAEYEGTEVGESIYMLCQMWRYMPDYVTDELYKALIDEIDLRYEMVQNDYELVEEKETYTQTIRSYEYRP